MHHRIETIPAKRLIGKCIKMSFADNKTVELWRSFMPRRKEILNNLGDELISMQIYPVSFDFNPGTEFEKWAAVEVSDFNHVPEEMETFLLPGGLYVVFLHKGSSNDNSTFRYIFTSWLPASDYILDERPHFEVLGKKYKNLDPDSEEEIWIPIKLK
jgi:AraC family transcriptional regulator